jgi:Fe2+ transport system protein FeoA
MRGEAIPGDVGASGAIPLLALAVGRAARIAEPPAGTQIPRRLADLGFVPGTELWIVRRAPFGDPIELEIRGYRLCLRAEQVQELRVLPAAAGSDS